MTTTSRSGDGVVSGRSTSGSVIVGVVQRLPDAPCPGEMIHLDDRCHPVRRYRCVQGRSVVMIGGADRRRTRPVPKGKVRMRPGGMSDTRRVERWTERDP